MGRAQLYSEGKQDRRGLLVHAQSTQQRWSELPARWGANHIRRGTNPLGRLGSHGVCIDPGCPGSDPQSPGLLCPTPSAAGAAGVGLGWKRGQQHHSLPGNVVVNFNGAPAKDLAGLHRAVEMHTLARHEPCGEERQLLAPLDTGKSQPRAGMDGIWLELQPCHRQPRHKILRALVPLYKKGKYLRPLSSGQWFLLHHCTGEKLGILAKMPHCWEDSSWGEMLQS